MFKGQPKGLYALALANTGERFGYYTMLAIFTLFLQAKFGFSEAVTSNIYAGFLAAVYFMPFIGGILADKFGYGKMVVAGIIVMFAGYFCLAIPTGGDIVGKIAMFGSLLLIAVGTGLFKGNLQVMVGNLYDDPKYSSKRDAAFSLFYMAINIGSLFAPTAATKITEFCLAREGLTYNGEIPALANQYLAGASSMAPDALSRFETLAAAQGATGDLTEFSRHYIDVLAGAYHWGFAVACVSLVLSILIYFGLYPDLLRFPQEFQACRRHTARTRGQEHSARRRAHQGADQVPYRGPAARLRSGYLLLDGLPAEWSHPDLLRP